MAQRQEYQYDTSAWDLMEEDDRGSKDAFMKAYMADSKPDTSPPKDVPPEVMEGGQAAYDEWLKRQQQEYEQWNAQDESGLMQGLGDTIDRAMASGGSASQVPMPQAPGQEAAVQRGLKAGGGFPSVPPPLTQEDFPPGGGKPGLHPKGPNQLIPSPMQDGYPPMPVGVQQPPPRTQLNTNFDDMRVKTKPLSEESTFYIDEPLGGGGIRG